jgi:hypothetical protein
MMTRRLTATALATPPTNCAHCGQTSHAAGRHPDDLCQVCEAFTRRKAGK